MKNHKKTFLLATVLGVVSSSTTEAGTLNVINNVPDQRIQLCIRGEGLKERERKNCFGPTVKAGTQIAYIVEKENVGGDSTFEVIASTGNGGDPDWALLGGACKNLVTDADHTILIDSTAGKLSCKNVTAKNPPAR